MNQESNCPSRCWIVRSDMHLCHLCRAAAFALLMLFSSLVFADGKDAASLFQQGRESMKRGDCAGALDSFARSQRLDPSIGTALNSGICHETLGNQLLAAEQYEFVARQAGSDDVRRSYAEKRLMQLDRRLARLILVSHDPSFDEASILLNGKPLAANSLRRPIRLSSGRHVLVLRAATPHAKTFELNLQQGETHTITIEALSPQPKSVRTPAKAASPPFPAPASSKTGGVLRESAPPRGDGGSSSKRSIAYVVGAAGVASLAVCLGTGLLVLQKKQTILDECDAHTGECSPKGLEARDSASQLAAVSTVTGAVAVAGLGVSAYLLLSDRGSSASAKPVAAGITLRLKIE